MAWKGRATRSARQAQGAPGSRDLRQLRRLAGYLRPYRWQVAATLVALALAAAAVLVFGIGLRYLIDGGFAAGRSGRARPRAQGVADRGRRARRPRPSPAPISSPGSASGWSPTCAPRSTRHVTGLSPAFFELTRTGEVLSRLTSDTAVIQAVVSASLSQALRNLLLLAGGLALLIVTNPKLTALVLVVVPLVVVPIVVIGRRVRRLSRAAQDRIGALGGHAEETLNAIRTVQAFAQEARERRRFGGAGRGGVRAPRSATPGRAPALAGVRHHAGVRRDRRGAVGRRAATCSPAGSPAASSRPSCSTPRSWRAPPARLSEIMGDLQRAAGATERLFELLDTRARDHGAGAADAAARARRAARCASSR